jgi:hypothetical protein
MAPPGEVVHQAARLCGRLGGVSDRLEGSLGDPKLVSIAIDRDSLCYLGRGIERNEPHEARDVTEAESSGRRAPDGRVDDVLIRLRTRQRRER